MLRPVRSLPDPAELAAVVAEAYRLEVAGCVLLRTLVNDVYRIDTPIGPYVLKLYGPRHRGDVAWEVRLAAHVAAGGVAIACGVPLADGRLAGQVTMPEGRRPYTLWEWAPGDRASPPFDDDLYRGFGGAIARFHAASAGIDAAPGGAGMESLLDDVLARVDAPDRSLISSLAAATSRHLAEVGPQLDRGVCHGDVTLDNAHLDGGRVVLYDLDRACDNWRAWDLVGVAATPHWPAFLAGYRTVRPLRDLDVATLPWLDVLLRIDYLHFHLVSKPTFRTNAEIAARSLGGRPRQPAGQRPPALARGPAAARRPLRAAARRWLLRFGNGSNPPEAGLGHGGIGACGSRWTRRTAARLSGK